MKHALFPLFFCLALFSASAAAATREEIQALDAALPAGSVIVCLSQVKGDGKQRLPVQTIVRAIVTDKDATRTGYDVRVMVVTNKRKLPDMMLGYHMTAFTGTSGLWMHIDPDSLTVSMPRSPDEEASVASGLRARFVSGDEWSAFSESNITGPTSWISLRPGHAPLTCNKKA